VFVVWEALLNGQSDIFYARSSNGGDSFMGRRNLSASAEDSFAPAIALLLDEINTSPPRLPGDPRPITYRLTTA